MNSFIKRTLSGAIVLLITILCVYFRGIPLILYTLSATSFCLIELLNSLKVKDLFIKTITLISSFCIIYSIRQSNFYMFLIAIFIYFIIASIYYLYSNYINIIDFSKLIFSLIYISIPLGIFLKTGYNSNIIWFVYIISWGTDTFAYLVGILFGKHKLCPTISPKKTIEGSLGGVVGSIILSNLFNYYFFEYNVITVNVVAIFSSVIAQIGDLFASKIKRQEGIKDFGNVISGHGGVLDRFDSIIFATPMIYITFYIFGGKF